MTAIPHTPHARQVRHLVRQDVLRFYRDRALSETRLGAEEFAERLAKAYTAMVPAHARNLDIQVPDMSADHRTYARMLSRLERRVRRYLDGDLHLPVELEEPWVAALPQPYQEACARTLARRYGFLGAKSPAADPCQDGEAVAYILTEVGELTGTLARALEDGRIGPEDFDGSGRLLRELDDAAAAIASVRARVVAAKHAIGEA